MALVPVPDAMVVAAGWVRIGDPVLSNPRLIVRARLTESLALLRPLTWQRALSLVVRLASVIAAGFVWLAADHGWRNLAQGASGQSGLGYDLKFLWLAERAFAHGQSPFSVPGFVYPPSSVLLFRWMTFVSFHTVAVVALHLTAFAIPLTAMIGAHVAGRRWWGLSAAVAAFYLKDSWPAGEVIVVENLTVLIAFAFAVQLYFATHGHWMTSAVILGITLSIKPLLLPVPILFILFRQWRPLAVAIGIPVLSNIVALFLVPGLGQFRQILPYLLNRADTQDDAYNSAIVSVARIVGLPSGIGLLLRVLAVLLAAGAIYLAWRRIADPRVQIPTIAGMLLIGLFLSGTLTEDHYMLALVPLAMTIPRVGSPMSWPLAWWGVSWAMGLWLFSDSTLGLQGEQGVSVQRCIGCGVILVSVLVALSLEPWIGPAVDRARRVFAPFALRQNTTS